jgi:hypothetical protein
MHGVLGFAFGLCGCMSTGVACRGDRCRGYTYLFGYRMHWGMDQVYAHLYCECRLLFLPELCFTRYHQSQSRYINLP